MASPLKSVDPSVGSVSCRQTYDGQVLAMVTISDLCVHAGACSQVPPWKENIYLVENDRRALERDIRRTKNRMEGDLKAVLEQSRRARGASQQSWSHRKNITDTNINSWCEFHSNMRGISRVHDVKGKYYTR